MAIYEFAEDFDGVEHVVLRTGPGCRAVCDRIDPDVHDASDERRMYVDPPPPEDDAHRCPDCRVWLAGHGDGGALLRAVMRDRARWLADLPDAAGVADPPAGQAAGGT